MKKNLKNASAKTLAVVLAAGMVIASAPVSGAKKVKKPTLGNTKVSITVGKTKKIAVKKNNGPKVKKVSISLTKKQKKIVKITKTTKTYFKVKGLKAGKTTLKVKVKAGKKTYTKKLAVTVTKASTVTPASTTKATTTPGGTTSTATPTATAPSTTKAPDASKSPDVTATPEAPAEKENITLTYDYNFKDADRVKFADAETGYPAYGINVADYAKVIVKIAAAKEIVVDPTDKWAGKCTLSSYDDGYGFDATSDGMAKKFFNDLTYENGFYTIEYDIPSSFDKGYTLEDAEYIDCIGLQLATSEELNSYTDLTLKEISFLLPEPGDVTNPTPTPEPGDEPTPTPVPAEEVDTNKIGDLTVKDISDVTTLKATEDAEGEEVVRIPFSATDQRVFFDVSSIDFTKIDSIKVTADVPGQMSFNLWKNDLDKNADKWWDGHVGAGYPFYGGSTINRKEDGAAGDPGKETYTFSLSGVSAENIANIGYLSLGTNKAPGGKDPWASAKYMIYSIEFVQKEAPTV